MAENKLTSALIAALGNPNSAGDRIRSVSKEEITTGAEAELVVRLLKLFPLSPDSSAKRVAGTPLRDVLAWMQKTKIKEATTVFRELGGPELLRIFDETIRATIPDDKSHAQSELLFLLKIVCQYTPKGGVERVVTAVRFPLLKDGFLWSVIFQTISNNRHPWRTEIVEELRNPLPEGFSAVAYLDLCNTIARSGELDHHPFDTEAGVVLLRGWLSQFDEDSSSYAHSAAASIPFLSPEARERVQLLADQHPDRGVRLEAAWAAAACGDARGYQELEAACARPQDASAAMHYLTELGTEDRIPSHAKSDDFKAISEMCHWLAHPMEFGTPPEEIHKVDSRELFWPPTNDRRKLWVFQYAYAPGNGRTEPKIGHGMVGSVTFALFGEATLDLTAEQVYGLHCAWELQNNRDARAPQKRTAEAGIEILREHNPGFAEPN